MIYNESPQFKKDVKRLSKKWRSIPNDIAAAKLHITPLYEQLDKNVSLDLYRQAFFSGKRAAILAVADESDTEVIKMRLDCETLGTNSKTRLIFVAVRSQQTVTFVELYAKNEKPREDPDRYRSFC